jgi:hypothetical protein
MDLPVLFEEIYGAFKKRGLPVPVSMTFNEEGYQALAAYADSYFKTTNYPHKTFFRIGDVKITKGLSIRGIGIEKEKP